MSVKKGIENQINIKIVNGARNILFSPVSPNPYSDKDKVKVTVHQIIEAVASFYGLKERDLTISRCRRREIVFPRQIAMYLLKTELNISYPNIGKEFGGRNHTTAMHAFKRIEKEIDRESRIKQEIEMIKRKIYGSA